MSLTPQISRVECIDNWGMPMSIVCIPRLAEAIGPIVDPHARSLLFEKT